MNELYDNKGRLIEEQFKMFPNIIKFYEYYEDSNKLRQVGYVLKTTDDGRTRVFTGKWTEYFENGKIYCISHFSLGKLHGDWISYFQNGNIDREGKYYFGLRSGLWKYYHKNGNIRERGKLFRGKYEGKWEFFNEKGDLIHTSDFGDIWKKI